MAKEEKDLLIIIPTPKKPIFANFQIRIKFRSLHVAILCGWIK